MTEKFSYPVFLSLSEKNCLLVGLGDVGLRKLRNLLAANPGAVLVLDIKPKENFSDIALELLSDKRVLYNCRMCTEADILKSFLVFAATNCREENARIAQLCRDANVLCNCATIPENGSFILPATIHKDSLYLAMTTGGASPALSRKWLAEQKNWLENKSSFATFMGRLRKYILSSNRDSAQNSLILNKIVNSSFEEWWLAGDWGKCAIWLKQELPPILYGKIEDILHDLT